MNGVQADYHPAQGATMKKADSNDATTSSQTITNHITELADWRGTLLARLRQLILDASPALVEEWKWGTPVWSHHGNVVAAGAFKDHIKLNFFKGAALPDPNRLFNAGLDAKATRAIDIHEGDPIDEPALQELIRSAVAQNASKQKTATR
jgi:hypothetical protein